MFSYLARKNTLQKSNTALREEGSKERLNQMIGISAVTWQTGDAQNKDTIPCTIPSYYTITIEYLSITAPPPHPYAVLYLLPSRASPKMKKRIYTLNPSELPIIIKDRSLL